MFYILFLILGAVFSVVLHETSHIVVAKYYGCVILEFRPYPHFYEEKFYFGRVSYLCGTNNPIKASALAPLIRAIAFGLTWGICGYFWKPLWTLAVWDLLDVINWFQGYVRGSGNDGGIYRKA